MTYEPRRYWDSRYAKHGALTVGRMGMTAEQVEAQADVFWSHVGPRIPRPCNDLLDFGSGPGRMARRLVGDRCDIRYWGVDLCAEAIRLADADPLLAPLESVVFHALDAAGPDKGKLPFHDGFFDCVVACTVLQHIVDDAQFAHWTKEIARVTRPGGVVVVLDGMGCAAHARSRTPQEVGEALGMEAVRWMARDVPGCPDKPAGSHWYVERCDGAQVASEHPAGPMLVDAESKGSHWCASFVKGEA